MLHSWVMLDEVPLYYISGMALCLGSSLIKNQTYSLTWEVSLPVKPVCYDNLLSFKDNWENMRPVL